MTLSQSLKITVLAAIALVVLAVSQQAISTTSATFDDSDGDGASDLAEELAGSDPNDPNSFPESTGAEFLTSFIGPPLPLCSDGIDNDLDGLTDSEDPGCTDSDNDILSDPAEVKFGSDPNDAASFPEDARIDAVLEDIGLPVFFCADGVDNDGDGLTDADDPGCDPIDSDGDGVEDAAEKRFGSDPTDPDSAPEHETPNPGSCSDGIDNDQNGLVDGADGGCSNPANDDRANATVVDTLPYADGPTVLKNATFEPDEPRPNCAFSLGGTIWYRYSAAEDSVLIANIEGDNIGTVIAVWRETASGLEGVACAADFSLTGARAVVSYEAGETYLFQIDSFPLFDTLLPSGTFTLEAGDPPANDGFTNALPIDAVPFSDSVDTTAATVQRGEPSCGYGTNQSSVWYSFSPDDDALVVADSGGSDYPVIIGVWTETKFGLIVEECSLPGSAVALEAEGGETYFFQVSRLPGFFIPGPEPEPFEPPGFSLRFSLSVAIPPANDGFANAQPVASLPFTMTVNNLTATEENDEPTPSCVEPYALEYTLWYRYTAARDEILVADTEGSIPYDIAIGVYTGDALADLTEAACTSFSFPTRVGFQAEAGTTYYFQLGTLTFEDFILFAGGADEQPDAAGIFFPIDPHEITFNLRTLDVPACPPPEFKVEDPPDDVTGFFFGPPPDGIFRPEMTSVGGAFTGDDFCITIEFDGALPAQGDFASGSVYGNIAIDIDQDSTTGLPYFSFQCGTEGRLGIDAEVEIRTDSLLAQIWRYDFIPIPIPIPIAGRAPEFEPDLFAVILRGERSLTVVVPLDAIGGDQFFGFTVAVYSSGFEDCVPNGGYITAPVPATLGDVNCDGFITSIDAALIVQMWAGLSQSLPCQHIADVNGSGVIGPIDALLILQYDAGLIADLPP